MKTVDTIKQKPSDSSESASSKMSSRKRSWDEWDWDDRSHGHRDFLDNRRGGGRGRPFRGRGRAYPDFRRPPEERRFPQVHAERPPRGGRGPRTSLSLSDDKYHEGYRDARRGRRYDDWEDAKPRRRSPYPERRSRSKERYSHDSGSDSEDSSYSGSESTSGSTQDSSSQDRPVMKQAPVGALKEDMVDRLVKAVQESHPHPLDELYGDLTTNPPNAGRETAGQKPRMVSKGDPLFEVSPVSKKSSISRRDSSPESIPSQSPLHRAGGMKHIGHPERPATQMLLQSGVGESSYRGEGSQHDLSVPERPVAARSIDSGSGTTGLAALQLDTLKNVEDEDKFLYGDDDEDDNMDKESIGTNVSSFSKPNLPLGAEAGLDFPYDSGSRDGFKLQSQDSGQRKHKESQSMYIDHPPAASAEYPGRQAGNRYPETKDTSGRLPEDYSDNQNRFPQTREPTRDQIQHKPAPRIEDIHPTLAAIMPPQADIPAQSSVAEPKSAQSDSDATVQNILRSIGFNFELSQLMQEKAKQDRDKDQEVVLPPPEPEKKVTYEERARRYREEQNFPATTGYGTPGMASAAPAPQQQFVEAPNQSAGVYIPDVRQDPQQQVYRDNNMGNRPGPYQSRPPPEVQGYNRFGEPIEQPYPKPYQSSPSAQPQPFTEYQKPQYMQTQQPDTSSFIREAAVRPMQVESRAQPNFQQQQSLGGPQPQPADLHLERRRGSDQSRPTQQFSDGMPATRASAPGQKPSEAFIEEKPGSNVAAEPDKVSGLKRLQSEYHDDKAQDRQRTEMEYRRRRGSDRYGETPSMSPKRGRYGDRPSVSPPRRGRYGDSSSSPPRRARYGDRYSESPPRSRSRNKADAGPMVTVEIASRWTEEDDTEDTTQVRRVIKVKPVEDDPPAKKLPETRKLTEAEKGKLEQRAKEKQKRLKSLEKELGRLRKQQNELMRKRQRQKDGHKDPLFGENSILQEEIARQILTARESLAVNNKILNAGVIGVNEEILKEVKI